jgi:hypothetical protein
MVPSLFENTCNAGFLLGVLMVPAGCATAKHTHKTLPKLMMVREMVLLILYAVNNDFWYL